MNRAIRHFPLSLLVLWAAGSNVAGAVCLDPKSGVSGYQVPLKEELDSSIAIVVAEIIAERKLFETPEDPEYYSVIYTVRTDQVLKGNPLKTFKLREELNSGRYPMSLGETHLLFITKWRWKVRGADYVIDACGNSARLPEGGKVVADVKQVLHESPHAP